jgi:hypothetical protein
MKINKSGKQNDENKFGCSPCIKCCTENQKDDILILIVCQIIDKQKDRQKENQKSNTAEYHLPKSNNDFEFYTEELAGSIIPMA